jgi:hypothetical protein
LGLRPMSAMRTHAGRPEFVASSCILSAHLQKLQRGESFGAVTARRKRRLAVQEASRGNAGFPLERRRRRA